MAKVWSFLQDVGPDLHILQGTVVYSTPWSEQWGLAATGNLWVQVECGGRCSVQTGNLLPGLFQLNAMLRASWAAAPKTWPEDTGRLCRVLLDPSDRSGSESVRAWSKVALLS